MRMSFPIFISLFFLFVGNVAKAEKKMIITAALSDWKPYAYKEDKVLKGYAYEIAKSVFERAGISLNYEIWPWARVYKKGLEEKNLMIGGLGRTPKREELFHWVGPVTKGVDVSFYKLKSNSLKIKTLEELKGYKIGVSRGSYNHDYLVLKGHKSSIFPVVTADQLLSLLQKGRIDFILINSKRLLKEAKAANIALEKFEKVLFAFQAIDYMAFNRKTSLDMIRKLRKAYWELLLEGKIVLH